MDRFLLIFGLLMFAGGFIFFLMNFISEYESTVFIVSIMVMLNAAIAIGVSEILSKLKEAD
ncbi:hypothetical protein [Jeotgalibacillus haloalkalitolerans]|uniref:DUF4305 domain-containing protein n=1 Tax=Jeotgalibacillus haloalkalitolerans TaxID=3104292 RepID=A0ABU5KJ68_9BACL|nr:hypothetical protein [Jeotgalibacillus sp. HH7-29]MDZ5710791.1 hypothetical protein [Jeotgalibacillus sp. HH7-29]